MYTRVWWFAMYFTFFWILYGGFVFFKNLVIENDFDIQPLYLILGMLILFFRTRKEYKKSKR